MPIIEISSLTHPGVDVFCMLTEAQLRQRMEPGKGVFIAESPNVISRALDAGYEPLALMCERKHISGSAAHIIKRCMRCDCGRNRLCSRKNGIRRSLRYDIRTGGNGAAPFFGSSFQVESDACIIRFFISENSRMIRKLQ